MKGVLAAATAGAGEREGARYAPHTDASGILDGRLFKFGVQIDF